MTRIKICGITSIEDARAAIEYGADALGFICVPESPRYVSVEQAYAIGRTIGPFVSKVAVVRDWADLLNSMPKLFDTFQYYSNERGFRRIEGVRGYSHRRNIRAYRIHNSESLEEIAGSYCEAYAILLDTYHKDKLGGCGETFNWELAVEAKVRFDVPLVLAGGLTCENVEEAIKTVHPYAVDVSTGVESEPGRKDHEKLRAFIAAVRRADARLD